MRDTLAFRRALKLNIVFHKSVVHGTKSKGEKKMTLGKLHTGYGIALNLRGETVSLLFSFNSSNYLKEKVSV